ncbi:PHA/PHB synthase family protein [Pseudorhodoferax sp.]|uniref:PHA/PHB synthase family protein n=1 Tax=Pseudorhodoferax sp. TaxID=1993553 RepID=UPI0039E2D83C
MSLPNAPAPTQQLDTLVHAALARMSGSLSPTSALLAWQDWVAHLAGSPGRQMALASLAATQAQALAWYLAEALSTRPGDARALVAPPAQDRRFAAPEWRQWPFNLWHQSFLLVEQWWDAATHGVPGVDPHHERVVAFWARQWLDMCSPGNRIATNPLVIKATLAEGGANLVRGTQHLLTDLAQAATGEALAAPGGFAVGRDLAATPGKVVLRNRVMELIQYQPTTAEVHPEPVLLVPAWIMKYYILDLSPHDSLVKYLLDQGHTVFCISWKNPGEAERDLGMDDYLRDGFFAALDAVNAICPQRQVHATGYCLGGTLLAIAAAAMARDGDARLASVSLFAAQTDFSEPGELALFIDESQVSLLEAQMAATGYLKASQMAGAFQMLRSYDLLWSRLVHDYLLGERASMNDLMAWNADATRMPARMHSEYLRRLFLNDDLSEGRYPVNGRPVALSSIRLPVFMVGTTTDHVAPWRSVHKLHHLCPAEITFALTSGGHNAGIVNPPVPGSHRTYQVLTRPAGGTYLAPDEWLAAAPLHQGSWWPAWQQWLAERSGAPAKPPRMGAGHYKPVADAPGQYVLEK